MGGGGESGRMMGGGRRGERKNDGGWERASFKGNREVREAENSARWGMRKKGGGGRGVLY